MNKPSAQRIWLTLLAGVLAVSTAALFIRFAQGSGASSLAIAAGRLTLASLIMVPLALASHFSQARVLSTRTHALFALIGLMLAVHFWTWISSLAYVSVALSTALAATVPIWVAVGAWLFRKEKLTVTQRLGLLLAMLGGIALAFVSGGSTPSAVLWLGCTLALASAVAISVNMLIGQSLRASVPVKLYAALLYGWAAIWLLIAVAVTRTPLLNLATNAYLAMIALALVPQLIGHTAFNWALPYLGATTVAVTNLAEPIGAAFFAAIFLNEAMTWTMLACFACTLVGIILVARR
jgi:drug/metabolite transporter (DMT)-like permease